MPAYRVTMHKAEEVPRSAGFLGVAERHPWSFVPLGAVGGIAEAAQTKRAVAVVAITDSLVAVWKLTPKMTQLVLFQVAKDSVIRALTTPGHLVPEITTTLQTYEQPKDCPYDVARMETPPGVPFDVDGPMQIGF